MGIVADKRNAMTVKVVSPDARIRGICGKDRSLTSLEFRPGCYVKYAERELEQQLTAVLNLLAEGYDRAWNQILIDAGRRPLKNPAQVDQEAWKKYLTELPEVIVTGANRDQSIRFRTKGATNFKCRLKDGVVSTLSEQEFADQAIAASVDLMRKFRFEQILLKDECWGVDIPAVTKERLRRKKERSASG